MEQQQKGLFSFSKSAACGSGGSTGQTSIRLSVTSTTGSPVELTVPRGETVEGLRTRISHRLRLQTHRIALLHKDRHLTAGKLLDLGVTDGSRLTLVPVIEAGLMCSTARAERTMMDVLESLTEAQINDFLSGRSPLTISLGIGAHMMYVQLQLSAQDVKKLQQNMDSKAQSSSEARTGLQTPCNVNHPGSASTDTTGSTTSSAAQTPSTAPDSSDSTAQFSPQRQRTSFHPAASATHSSTYVHSPLSQLHSQTAHTSPHAPSTPSLPSGCPHPSSPREATAPVCLTGPSGSSPGPPSPVPASTFTERNINASSRAEMLKEPGAVIESFVNHSPGVFSGTFSGTLPPCSQSGISHPRRGIAIILQILNDLLRAAYHHQGAPAALPLHPRPASNPPVSPLPTAEEQSRTRIRPPVTPRTEHLPKAPGDDISLLHSSTEENQTMHCKLEHLQLLMHQRRLRRRTRRSSHVSQTSHPYQHRHYHP
ncbi:midnolin-like [Acanthochromis polyacanthus]|uniref:Midnolin-like n=1 Tax=Acanthochromis polyacanthus TaxID=80966 RepID=A0A3Q1G5F6_9TELE|nr:midnolin-like [Acanthochromis polyacanthus]